MIMVRKHKCTIYYCPNKIADNCYIYIKDTNNKKIILAKYCRYHAKRMKLWLANPYHMSLNYDKYKNKPSF